MRLFITLFALAALALLLSVPAAAAPFVSLGVGTGYLSVNTFPPAPPGVSTSTGNLFAADGKLGFTLGSRLDVYADGKACDVSSFGEDRIHYGLVGAGINFYLGGDRQGYYLIGVDGKSFWQDKNMQNDPFMGNGYAAGIGRTLSSHLAIEGTYIKGQTSGMDGGFTTDTKMYMGTLDYKF